MTLKGRFNIPLKIRGTKGGYEGPQTCEILRLRLRMTPMGKNVPVYQCNCPPSTQRHECWAGNYRMTLSLTGKLILILPPLAGGS
jgi:hypothetical protein